jgi:hypothetical protein
MNAAIDQGGQMAGERTVTVNLDADTTMVVVAEQIGPALVADADVVAKLGKVTDSIERVCREVLDALKRTAPKARKPAWRFSSSRAIHAWTTPLACCSSSSLRPAGR